MPLNLNGRICLLNSLLFGAMSVIGLLFVHPFILSILSLIPLRTKNVFSFSMFIILSVDFAFTLGVLFSINKKLATLKLFMEGMIERIGETAWFDVLDLGGSLNRLKDFSREDVSGTLKPMAAHLEKMMSYTRREKHIYRAFPTMQNKAHEIQLAAFKKHHALLNSQCKIKLSRKQRDKSYTI